MYNSDSNNWRRKNAQSKGGWMLMALYPKLKTVPTPPMWEVEYECDHGGWGKQDCYPYFVLRKWLVAIDKGQDPCVCPVANDVLSNHDLQGVILKFVYW